MRYFLLIVILSFLIPSESLAQNDSITVVFYGHFHKKQKFSLELDEGYKSLEFEKGNDGVRFNLQIPPAIKEGDRFPLYIWKIRKFRKDLTMARNIRYQENYPYLLIYYDHDVKLLEYTWFKDLYMSDLWLCTGGVYHLFEDGEIGTNREYDQ